MKKIEATAKRYHGISTYKTLPKLGKVKSGGFVSLNEVSLDSNCPIREQHEALRKIPSQLLTGGYVMLPSNVPNENRGLISKGKNFPRIEIAVDEKLPKLQLRPFYRPLILLQTQAVGLSYHTKPLLIALASRHRNCCYRIQTPPRCCSTRCYCRHYFHFHYSCCLSYFRFRCCSSFGIGSRRFLFGSVLLRQSSGFSLEPL